MKQVNPSVKLTAIAKFLTDENAGQILKGHDVIVDALDNIKTRLLLQNTAAELDIPLAHGSIDGWYGQVTTIFPSDRTLDYIYAGIIGQDVKPVLGNLGDPRAIEPLLELLSNDNNWYVCYAAKNVLIMLNASKDGAAAVQTLPAGANKSEDGLTHASVAALLAVIGSVALIAVPALRNAGVQMWILKLLAWLFASAPLITITAIILVIVAAFTIYVKVKSLGKISG